jgi:hypothetical protein
MNGIPITRLSYRGGIEPAKSGAGLTEMLILAQCGGICLE